MDLRRALIVPLLFVLLAAACGGESPEPPRAADRDDASPGAVSSPSPSPAAPAEDETFAYEVWFHRGNFLYPLFREAPATPRVAATAIGTLLEGAPAAPKGVSTAIPEGTELLGISIDEGVATIDLTGTFDDGGGSASMFTRLAQVVFTLTQFPTVDSVAFELDGEPVEVFSSEGIVLDRPQTRADFENLAPPIIVTSPRAGAEVSSPVVVEGTANVFEATVSIRIVARDGTRLADTFTTATCGTGCRGDYSQRVSFEVSEPTSATIRVFESSAEDGSPLHMIRIPVTLVP